MIRSHRPAFVGLVLLAVGAVALTGCMPRGEGHGRMDPTATDRTERESREILPATLIEFSDDAADHVLRTLRDIDEIEQAEGRATVILGDLNNQTRIVSTNDFEVMARRLRGNLLNSDAGEQLAFVERRTRMEGLAARERIGDGGRPVDVPDYDPATTYTLNGNFYRISRGDTDLYYMDFELVHFESNRIVNQVSTDAKRLRMR